MVGTPLRTAGAALLLGILRLRVTFALWRENHTPLRMTELRNIRVIRGKILLHEAAGVFLSRPADGQAIDLDGRNAYTHRHGLPIFAAGADAFV